MTMTLEEAVVKSDFLPTNSMAAIKRLEEIVREHGCLQNLQGEPRTRARALVWLLNAHLYGELAIIDLMEEYGEIAMLLS